MLHFNVMRLFNLLKKSVERPETPKATQAVVPQAVKKLAAHKGEISPALAAEGTRGGAAVLLRPRVTEKATALSERGVYAFEVTNEATKRSAADAVRALYKKEPVKVAFVPLPRKTIIVKGKKGRTKGGKKAYVYLKPGEKIDNI